MAGVELGTLWSAAGVIAGFQVAAFTWRITHELYMSDKGEPVAASGGLAHSYAPKTPGPPTNVG
jgi:hypothetical protein